MAKRKQYKNGMKIEISRTGTYSNVSLNLDGHRLSYLCGGGTDEQVGPAVVRLLNRRNAVHLSVNLLDTCHQDSNYGCKPTRRRMYIKRKRTDQYYMEIRGAYWFVPAKDFHKTFPDIELNVGEKRYVHTRIEVAA